MQRDRTLRTMQLTISCISNIAAYRVNWQKVGNESKPIVQRDFWIRMNGNFLDMAVLEWCKLFADFDGKHHWSCTFSRKSNWRKTLFASLNMSSGQFKRELKLVSDYRNKFVAHLDDPIAMNYPYTEFMLTSASFLHDSLRNHTLTKEWFVDYEDTAKTLYERRLEDASDEIKFVSARETEFINERTKFQQ
jgi:hypothetical protein